MWQSRFENWRDETIVDGEVVAFDTNGRPSFNLLQNYQSLDTVLGYYVFDRPHLAGKSLQARPLSERRELLQTKVIPRLGAAVRFSESFAGPSACVVKAVFHQSAAAGQGPLGLSIKGREDEGMPLAQAKARRSDRIRHWTEGDHLRHSRFIALREDEDAQRVRREEPITTGRAGYALETQKHPLQQWSHGLTGKKANRSEDAVRLPGLRRLRLRPRPDIAHPIKGNTE